MIKRLQYNRSAQTGNVTTEQMMAAITTRFPIVGGSMKFEDTPGGGGYALTMSSLELMMNTENNCQSKGDHDRVIECSQRKRTSGKL
jgi:hypothetical protein